MLQNYYFKKKIFPWNHFLWYSLEQRKFRKLCSNENCPRKNAIFLKNWCLATNKSLYIHSLPGSIPLYWKQLQLGVECTISMSNYSNYLLLHINIYKGIVSLLICLHLDSFYKVLVCIYLKTHVWKEISGLKL